jgi:hypothetical protein
MDYFAGIKPCTMRRTCVIITQLNCHAARFFGGAHTIQDIEVRACAALYLMLPGRRRFGAPEAPGSGQL